MRMPCCGENLGLSVHDGRRILDPNVPFDRVTTSTDRGTGIHFEHTNVPGNVTVVMTGSVPIRHCPMCGKEVVNQ